MTRRAIFSGAVAAFVVAAVALGQAQGRGRLGGGLGSGLGAGQGRMGGRAGQMPGGRGGPGAGPVAELARLNLTADQKEKVRAIVEADRDATRDEMQALNDARAALHDAIYAVTPDAAAIASLQAKVSAAENAQLARDVKMRLAISQILTPDQKAQLVRKTH